MHSCSEGGLGEALVREFQRRGYKVFATARRTESMQTLDELPNVTQLFLDVTDLGSIRGAKILIEEETGGRLDVLVNNAGIAHPYAITDCSLSDVKHVFDVNVFSQFTMVQEFLPLLRASDDARIILVGSQAGIAPVPFGAAYNASKAALISFGDTLRVELKPFGIKVITTVLGNVRTNIINANIKLPQDSIYDPIRAEYQASRIDHFQDDAVPRDLAARQVVDGALRASPAALVWGGANVWLVWFMSTFLLKTVFVGFFRYSTIGLLCCALLGNFADFVLLGCAGRTAESKVWSHKIDCVSGTSAREEECMMMTPPHTWTFFIYAYV
ncbi:NAD-P-binding protein [Stereum hirsutum FP-91666 SS1]|uniref:NAD-P-binding protein n=1 Tax=Stereum hirsutum (strain FP-91666) TaxID=721885 RepID=UPI000440E779|nr:NAD-P-binding protein [Stereum hirsutum FP-91666 SS1]EIM89235.1 NAD-P-binding protein [Stereum hirsutum FP-91666 SS1]